MAYGLKYTTYKVVGDTRYTLRIYQKDYNGASFGIGTLTGFSLQIQGDQSSLIAPIIKTSVNISLKDFFNRGTTQSGVTCIEDGEKMGQWEEFYTRDPLKYRIDVLVGASNPTTMWSGYLTPDSWGEEMQYGGDINITARDMLGYLDEQEFDLTGRTSIQNLIQSAITKSQSAMAVAFKTTDCLYNSNGQSILAATIDASTYSGQTWYQALEKCLESLGLVLRYNGDNGFFVTSLRHLISYTHEYSTAMFTGRSGYRTLDPAVKQIVEVFDPKIEAYIAPDPANDAYTEVTGQYVTEEPFFNGTISTHYVPKYTLPLPSGIEGWNGNLAVPAMYTLSDDAPKRTMFFPTDVTTGEVAYYRNSALKAPFILNIGCDALCYMYNGRIYPSNGNGFAQKVEKVLVHITCSVGGTTYGLAANGEWSAGNGEELEVALDADFNVPACENGTNYILKVDNIATYNLYPVEHAYLAALKFGFSPAEANDLAGEYKTTTKYNESNHTEISRDPSIGSATSTMVSLPMVKNILGYGNDIADDAWKFSGDANTFPLAVMIHAQIIVYYGQMEDSQGRETGNSIFTGNFIDSQQTPLVPSTRYTYFGKTCTLLSGAYNFLTGGVDSATLREFFTWSSVWDTFDPQYSVKTSRNEGGTASAGGGGSASGGGGSTGGSVTSVDMSVPTGMTIGGNPITTRGTLALGLAEGYNFLTDSYKATLDGHLGSSSNPHNVTWAQVNSASGDNKIQTAYIGDGQVTLAKLAQGIRDILDLFEKDTTSVEGQTLIHAKYALYSHEEITAGGIGSGGGGGSTFTAVAYANLAALTSEEMSKIPTAWAAKKLQDRIATLESTTPNVSWGTAGADYVPLNVNGTTKNLLTAHQSLSGYATTSALSAHTGNTTIHITASERSTWNGKQSAISDLTTIRNNASNGNTAYGWGNHANAGYQPAATAITTSNIGSQSVAYATSAGTISGAVGNAQSLMYSRINGDGDYHSGAIQIREVDGVLSSQSDWAYAPAISFHWGCRVIGKFGLRSDGNLAWNNNTIYHSGNCNKTSTPWSASSLTLNGAISGATTGAFSQGVTMATSSGNVGIGTTSPNAKLEVAGTLTVGGLMTTRAISPSADKTYQLGSDSNYWSDFWVKGVIHAYHYNVAYNQPFIVFDKPGSHTAGIGPDGTTNRIKFGPVNGMATTSPSWIAYSTFNSNEWYFQGAIYSTYNITAEGEVTAGSSSDARFKDNQSALRNARAVLSALKPMEFDWNSLYHSLGGQNEGHDVGFLAQDVQPLIPSAIGKVYGDYLRLDYNKVTPYLVAGWQNHESRIEALEHENAELKNTIARLTMNS